MVTVIPDHPSPIPQHLVHQHGPTHSIRRNNVSSDLLEQIGYYAWTDGKVAGYMRYVEDGLRFGTKEQPIMGEANVQIPGDEVQQKIDARLREIGKTAKLKGFRPGRIPMKVLQQRYGPSVRQEIVSQTMQSSM